MKKQLFLLVCVLFSTLIMSDGMSANIMDDRAIRLRAEEETEDLRSVLPVRAWLNDKTVCVSFYNLPESATIIITDAQGNAVITKQYQSPQTLSIPINEYGEYKMEICYGSKCLVGDFELK